MKYRNDHYSLNIILKPYHKGHKLYVPFSTPYNGDLKKGAIPNDINYLHINNYVNYKKRNTWFSPDKNTIILGEKENWVGIFSTLINENITPRDYADLLYDSIGSILVYNFKSVTKKELDDVKQKIDWNYVDSFTYPAPFSEQRYESDDKKIFCYSWNGKQMETLLEPVDAEVAYNEYFNKTKYQQLIYKIKIMLTNIKMFLHYKRKRTLYSSKKK